MKYRHIAVFFFFNLERCCKVTKNKVFNIHLHKDNGIVRRVWQQLGMLLYFKHMDVFSVV